jgi:putative ABC transport system permease protein
VSPRGRNVFKLAWSQLFAEKRRLLAALAGISFAVLLQLMQFGFRDALFTSSTMLHNHLAADLVVTSSQYEFVLSTGTIPQRRLYQALALPQATSVVPVYLGVAPFKNIETHDNKRIVVIAYNPDQTVFDEPSIVAATRVLRLPDTAIFDALSLPDFGPVVDEVRRKGVVTTEIGGRRTRIAGLFELGVSFAGNGHLIMSDIGFRQMFNRPEGTCEFGLVRLKPGSDVAAARDALAALLPNDVRVLTRQQFVDREKAFWDKTSPIGFIFMMGLAVALLVGAVIVYQILYTDVSDHLGEYATLKAMGYSDGYLYAVVLREAVMLSVFGYPIGFVLAQLIYMAARNATHLAIAMTPSRAATVFVLTIVMCAGSGLTAMRKLRSADPAEIF